MTRLWPVTRFVLLLAVGYLAVEGGGGYATVAVLAWWVAYWGLRDDLRWECAGPISHFVMSSPNRFTVGDYIVVNQGALNEVTLQVIDQPSADAVHVRKPGRWVR